jgi:NAD(P)-dependent dehydrogenase (short-subunit alcohol dehydrogenase family)
VNLGKLPEADMAFDGQRVVVVGASAGIGEATARAFAVAGADVIITGRSKERLDAAAERIGQPVQAAELDSTDGAAVTSFFASLGTVDHLVLAASPGAVGSGPFAALDEAALRQAFDGKFFAHFNVLKAASVRNSVTIISAASARAAFPGSAGLAAVNGALEAIVPPLAVELAPLRVNAVSPGVIDTPWWDVLPREQRAAFFRTVASISPVGRVGTAQDVADAVLYLAGAGFVTGTVLECTGGANLTAGAAGSLHEVDARQASHSRLPDPERSRTLWDDLVRSTTGGP